MSPELSPYTIAIASVTGTIAITSALVFVSAAVTNGKNLHAGLTPTDIDTFAFRAFRSHHNALENAPVFAVTTLIAILLAASPSWVNGTAVVFLIARTLHPAFYYANIAAARTGAYGIGLLAWYSMLGAVFSALLTG